MQDVHPGVVPFDPKAVGKRAATPRNFNVGVQSDLQAVEGVRLMFESRVALPDEPLVRLESKVGANR